MFRKDVPLGAWEGLGLSYWVKVSLRTELGRVPLRTLRLLGWGHWVEVPLLKGSGWDGGASTGGTGCQGWTGPPRTRWTLWQRGLSARISRQNNPPYNTGAFRFELTFSPNHPLVPPCATLRTPIYHPSVDLEGRVCQPLITHAHWEPSTRAIQGGHRGDRGTALGLPLLTPLLLGVTSTDPPAPAVLQDLLLQLDSPDLQRVLRPDVARELQERPEEFRRRAEEHTRLHAEPRPDPHT